MPRAAVEIDPAQAELEEEDTISGSIEDDEIMEDVEEQEDGYSAC